MLFVCSSTHGESISEELLNGFSLLPVELYVFMLGGAFTLNTCRILPEQFSGTLLVCHRSFTNEHKCELVNIEITIKFNYPSDRHSKISQTSNDSMNASDLSAGNNFNRAYAYATKLITSIFSTNTSFFSLSIFTVTSLIEVIQMAFGTSTFFDYFQRC